MAKMGRPTESLKDGRVTARVDMKVKKILDDYCEKHHISQEEGLRQGHFKITRGHKIEGRVHRLDSKNTLPITPTKILVNLLYRTFC